MCKCNGRLKDTRKIYKVLILIMFTPLLVQKIGRNQEFISALFDAHNGQGEWDSI